MDFMGNCILCATSYHIDLLILYLNRSVQPIQSREYATTFDEIRH